MFCLLAVNPLVPHSYSFHLHSKICLVPQEWKLYWAYAFVCHPISFYLKVEEHVEVWDADVLVFHLPAHVLDGVDGCLVVAVGLRLQRKVFHPVAADLVQFAEH